MSPGERAKNDDSSPNPLTEIELHAELVEARHDDLERRLPGVVGLVQIEHRARIERVVDIDVRPRAGAAKAQELREAEVELVQPYNFIGASDASPSPIANALLSGGSSFSSRRR
jgi:hypothetical protein